VLLLRRLREIPQQIVRRQIILKHREETMKIRLLLALVGSAISFALPTFAQQRSIQRRNSRCVY
jgi:hypothetical protein